MWFEKIAKETADTLAKYSPEEHIPLGKVMVAMAIKAISVAGMGREFFDKKEIEKLETAYEVVRIGVPLTFTKYCNNTLLSTLL